MFRYRRLSLALNKKKQPDLIAQKPAPTFLLVEFSSKLPKCADLFRKKRRDEEESVWLESRIADGNPLSTLLLLLPFLVPP